MPQAKLWAPCLVLGHVFAAVWLVKAYLITRTQRFIKRRGLSLSGKGVASGTAAPPAPSSESSCGVSTEDVEACCTVSNVNPAAARDDSGSKKDDQSTDAHGTVPSKLPLPSLLSHGTSNKCNNTSSEGSTLQLESDAVPVTVEWQALGCIYDLHGETKVVLQNVWGKAEPGQMQALMGPSGAGKSTLMDMLALRKSVGNLTGRLLVDGQQATAGFIRQTSYVPQENTFIPTMTSRETLIFYAGVTLGDNWSRSQRKERVAEVLAAVGLADSAHTPVGGVLPGGLTLRGLSGGEMRRLSIAAGILARPSMLFLDEPTSGLDSFAALSVMGYLRHFAQATRQTVIATIHQPRSAIWEMFDTVSLLSSGRLMFHGPCADVIPWFQELGYTYHKGSESDWVLDLVATGFDKPSDMFGHTLRTAADVSAAADAFHEHYMTANGCQLLPVVLSSKSTGGKAGSTTSSSGSPRKLSSRLASGVSSGGWRWQSQGNLSYPTHWGRQFVALIKRELAGMTRNPFDVAARVLTFTYVALLYGLMGYKVVFEGVEGFRSRNNILFVTNLNTMLFPYISISLFTSDKRVYLTDASAKRYRPSAYYVAKVLATLPFTIVCTVCYSGILYGLSGLRADGVYFARYTVITSLFYMIACQVLHLASVLMPNQDSTFALSIMWSTVQVLCSSFFISFTQPYNQWLTQLRYISAFYFSLEALMQNELRGGIVDCSKGLNNDQVDMLTSGVGNMTPLQKAVLNQLKQPQPGCVFHEDVLLEPMGFDRPYGTSVGILVGYLGVLHVLTFLALVVAARRERR